ncbi:low molecular weight protein-tyrosine-phosphatase [Bizionia sediminis]|uniref:protein-tyrosine-phosphatase n=1 Tax=Bizionia sediminis TaxID=1737064 RepID=A0ABW5KU82_9FLAO
MQSKQTKILMVCLGNICRSPLAEGILKSKLPSTNFVVDSAGTGDYHINEAPDPRSIQVAKKYGIDISEQRGRQFKVSDFKNFDFIYVMDSANYTHVVNMAPNPEDAEKVTYILNEVYPNQNHSVPDPYTGGIQGFESTFKMLDDACNRIAEKLQS